MATLCSEVTANLASKDSGNEIHAILRRCRGRPRLSDTDRARRRLESRKKYDVRRVYLGESHKVWSDLRQKSCMSDAGLAEYLILLNSAYGEKYQQKYCLKNFPELCGNQKKGKKVAATSLHSLVSWYQQHLQMCAHEPELRSVEPTLGLSTTVLWQCDAEHSFIQHISWPVGGSSESDEDNSGEPEPEKKTTVQTTATAVSNQRTLAEDELESATAEVSKAAEQVSPTALSHLPESHSETVTSSTPLGDRVSWETETEQERELAVADRENKVRDDFPLVEASESKAEVLGGHDPGTDGYECVVVTAALMENLHEPDGANHLMGSIEENRVRPISGGMTHTPTAATPVQAELYETQALQSMVGSCELPDQHATLQGSQLIIITGSGYEAMTSEGIHLNVGGGDVEGVTCTVIEGMSYHQMCQSEAIVQNSISHTDTMTDLNEKQLMEPSEESHSQKDIQCSLSRSKRNRQGPVIEADGMLKMFHCPYEGCSQVYVALSSYQNHVNLVHRKGRTKVCPHPGCGKKFYLSNHLHRHMIIHSGVRDFICETCGKSFKRKNHLEVHRRTHTGETPLQCEICGYQCRQRASLNWHMKKHTSEAHFNYTCEHCGKRFEKLDSVKFHKLKSHPDRQTT
ncbi:zinc finger protein 653 isoform X2 [Neoarius graeffei]|uniref:zinc finger protein 653 isoform X2 n=1 Tax=Neoarius graeffei TaxID=443677 RepID=UPI00298CDD60|nr:zinc finger protein 653 isoform X2 [Neoarius graeffei]